MASKDVEANAAKADDAAQLPQEVPPPQYFDSEPSSQSPPYEKSQSKQGNRAPTSAASIAAIMGPPPSIPEKKRSWADRWRDLRSGENYGRNLNSRRGIEERSAGLGVGASHSREVGSQPRLSVFGSVLTEAKERPASAQRKK